MKRKVCIIWLLVLLILPSFVLSQNYPIKWNPERLEQTMGNGIGATGPVSVSFKSKRDLSDIDVWINPKLKPFIKANPIHFDTVTADTDYEIVLNFTIPPNTIEGLYEGTIHLRKLHRTYPQSLKVKINVDYGENFIPPNTKVLSDSSAQYLTDISEDGTILTFSQNIADLENIVPGDILVIGITEITPYGLLAKVDFLSESNGETKIHISSATLEDAIYDGDIVLSKTLSPNDVINTAALPDGVSLLQSSKALESELFNINFDNVILYDFDGNHATTSDQIIANGGISFSSRFDFMVKIRAFVLKELLFKNTLSETANLAISANVAVSLFDKKIEIARIALPSIKMMVGWLPVWITPVLTVDVGLNGEVSINVVTDITQEATLESGVSYDNGNWNPISDFSNRYDFNPPSLSAGCNLQVHAIPQLALMVYGVLGVYGAVDGYLELNAELASLCLITWELWGGINVGVGVKVEVLSKTLVDKYAEVITLRDLLFGGQIHLCPHTISDPNIPSGPIDGVVNSEYSYTTGGSVCSFGHNIEYQFDWGDLSLSNWSSSTSVLHSWTTPGLYNVKARARCTEDHANVSSWSSGLSVQVSYDIPSGEILFFTDFDDGTKQGWGTRDYSKITTEESYSSPYSIMVNDIRAGGDMAECYKGFDPVVEGETEFQMYVPSGNTYGVAVGLCDHAAWHKYPNHVFIIYFKTDGSVQWADNSGYRDFPNPASIAFDRWNKIKIKWDTSNYTVNLTINGVNYGNGSNRRTGSNIQQLLFQGQSWMGVGIYSYFDDIKLVRIR
jgi:hypothetical protein